MKNRIVRVVLDTNVLISSFLNPEGLPAAVVLLAVTAPHIRPCMTVEIYTEYQDVLQRPKFGFPQSGIAKALGSFQTKGLWVRPKQHFAVCQDAKDNCFLDCAAEARAEVLVTGNTRHFPKTWGMTAILTPREFLSVIEDQ